MVIFHSNMAKTKIKHDTFCMSQGMLGSFLTGEHFDTEFRFVYM